MFSASAVALHKHAAQVRNVLRGVAHCRPETPAAVLSALDRAMCDYEAALVRRELIGSPAAGRPV